MSLYDPPIIATGGDTVQDINGNRIHTFTTVGTSSFVVTRGGPVEVLVVAGGGGGGESSIANIPGGGGGAGELIYKSSFTVSGFVSVTVGAGGSKGIGSTITDPTNGGDSSFGTITSKGGGRGGRSYQNGSAGGSGGGGGRGFSGAASTKNSGYGNAGGSALTVSSGGGGGGAGGVGLDSYNGAIKTPGGSGIAFSISGTSVTYAQGGNGGARNLDNSNGSDALQNTGSGGGGASSRSDLPNSITDGGSGGSGIVIVRYPLGTVLTGQVTSGPWGILTATPNGLTADQAATSGLALRQGYPNYTSGTYWLKPTSGSTPGLAFVDMTTDGGGWTMVYETVTATRVGDSIVYSINNSSNLSALSFTRVAYSMNNFNSWAFTSFDSWSSTITNHRIPSPNDVFVNQRRVTNLNVVSSNANVTTGTGLGGALEIWPYNYLTGRTLSMGTYGSDSTYDINDIYELGGSYGSFQVHDITNLRPVICWNNHSASSPDIGFGPQAINNPDWTFNGTGATADFRVRVFVR